MKLKLSQKSKRWLLFLALFSFVAILAKRFNKEIKKIESVEITAWTQDHRADCGVVLTGSAGRVREGFDLLSQKRIQKLIISGVYPQATLRDIFPQWPFYGSLNENDVILEKKSQTTYGNAQQSLRLLKQHKCSSFVLITSNIHMYRARKLFNSLKPREIILLSRSIASGSLRSDKEDVLYEAVKSLFYSLWAY